MAFSPAKMPNDEALKELNRGFELTRRLRVLLRQIPRDDLRREPASLLSQEVLRSLTAALCILESPGEVARCSRPPRDPCGGTDSDGQIPRGFAGKEHHGCRTRRNKRSRTEELTATPYSDGHQWRKYGQKRIAGANFTRSYYRCTYSDVDGCEATKQVQREEGDQNEPQVFRVKYDNDHTCRNMLIGRSLELMETATQGSSPKQALLSFGMSDPRRCKEVRLLSFSSSASSLLLRMRQEHQTQTVCCHRVGNGLRRLGLDQMVIDPSQTQTLTRPHLVKEEAVSGDVEDELSWVGYENLFQLDLELDV